MDYDLLKTVNVEPVNEEAPKTTKDNPLVFVWDSEKSADYPEQGIVGHMHLGTAAKIERFDPEGLADKLAKAGTGKRIKAGKKWLEYSKWNKEELKESHSLLNEMNNYRLAMDLSTSDLVEIVAYHMWQEMFQDGDVKQFMDDVEREMQTHREKVK